MRTATGLSELYAQSGSVTVLRQHVVVTRAPDASRVIYVDGVESGNDSAPDATTSDWVTSFGVTCANATSFDAPWLGTYHLVAFYGRVLSAPEVAQNFAVGPR